MELKSLFARARRGIREEARLYLVSVTSLSVAFLCLAGALLALANLSELAQRWGRSHHMSIYLKADASPEDTTRLIAALQELSTVATVEHLSAAMARERFLRDLQGASQLDAMPEEAFPPSVEVTFRQDAPTSHIQEVARKVAAFGAAVDEVDTYQSWFGRLGSVLATARTAAVVVAVVVMLCVFAVVANTIRLAVANRREEIELLRICGATNGFVRGPFVLEGALQGLCAAALSLVFLMSSFFALRTRVDQVLSPITGMELLFLPPAVVAALLLAGAALGALGSLLSVRHYMAV
jgi:cell division transport system permease protein